MKEAKNKDVRVSVASPLQIKQVGNGFFIPIPKRYADKMQLAPGDDIDVTVGRPETRRG